MASPDHDVLIIGGGPAGATAGIVLARAGLRTLILERACFPRFHIGESLLPRNFPLIAELGLAETVRHIPHVPKFGVEFAMGDGSAAARFPFELSLLPGTETINVERASFDAMLLNAAKDAGADVREGVVVRKVIRLSDGDVAVEADGREISARWLIDASGQGTLVGRHLGTRQASGEPQFQKVAYFEHFERVSRLPGREGGYPLIVMADEGWFWLIPLDERRTSLGLVLDARVARGLNVPADQLLAWGIERCPTIRTRMGEATGPQRNRVAADFSYSCRPYAGSGYFLAGDAAAFVDPIFSTGVCLAMISGQHAAMQIAGVLRGARSPAAARRDYLRLVDGSTDIYFRLIRQYYDHSFRELFLNGSGPFQVHRAVLAVLAGQVFPKPAWCLRWRLWLFHAFVVLNRYLPLVPRRARFALLAPEAVAREASVTEMRAS